jgi:hypothetical protein
MRARLQKFLPLVLLALAMQVLAPIAACLAAGVSAADALQNAVICHSVSEQGGASDQTGVPAAHGGVCALCCLAQANASLDSPQTALSTPVRIGARVIWHEMHAGAVTLHGGSNTQARAPPQFS